MTIHTIPTLQDEWHTSSNTIASSCGKGSDKTLSVKARFDGQGNSIVWFEVEDHERATTFTSFDLAASYYNQLK